MLRMSLREENVTRKVKRRCEVKDKSTEEIPKELMYPSLNKEM
jgi:hypothetical protein